jgi:ribonuclease HII
VPDFAFELNLNEDGFELIAGVDEAGRGPLAGPVAAAAVILDPRKIPAGLDDSKALSAKKREKLFGEILSCASGIGVAFSSAAEIDRINIRQACLAAMRRAVRGLSVRPSYILVDGNDLPLNLPCPARTIVKGDSLSLSIAAASIVAKVTRDRLMQRLATEYPVYGFDGHAGYGTREHIEAIERHGPCPFHRMSFAPLKRFNG